MLDEIIAFLLSLGIVGALIAWGFVCGMWHRQDQTSESPTSQESFRDNPALLTEWWKR